MDIWVYAHWTGMVQAKCIGILSAHYGKGRKSFSFKYDNEWLESKEQFILDPDIHWYSGMQFPGTKENFGVFLDSMPDTWGKTLMKRRVAYKARETNQIVPNLYDIDFLLGVYDKSRMGALRFKTDPKGSFLDDNNECPTPPWSSINELQFAANRIESDTGKEDIKKWLAILIAPGSSLGGARPKANIIDNEGHLWIAKFPSKNDEIDKALWEYLVYKLALEAGVEMSKSIVQKVSGKHHTFLTKRFDRHFDERIHFASAMTMTGYNEDILREGQMPSYLEIAEFIQFNGVQVEKNLSQLWRRIVFNIAVSNTDDHLRNHGFIIKNNGWQLSPAYDINPSIDKDGLAINIDMDSNDLDFKLAKSVGHYFRLNNSEMDQILNEVQTSVKNWKTLAQKIGLSHSEQELMKMAFRITET